MWEGGQPHKKRREHGKVGGVSCKKRREKERQEVQLSIPYKDLTCLNMAALPLGLNRSGCVGVISEFLEELL